MNIILDDKKLQDRLENIINSYNKFVKEEEESAKEQILRIKAGDDLSQGILQVIKVYIAVKRKIQIGDKMAGRHGNKGVISTIIPIENMPYLEDGTPLDMILKSIRCTF